jgi:branched-chain amino acid transport system ATP-binding protein
MKNILEVNGLKKSFGQVTAVENLSFEVRQGEILGLMGPNGAGKTTVFNLLTGVLKADNGRIIFNTKDITEAPAHKRARLGIGRTYQVPQPFEKMTIYENLLVCAVHGGRMSEKKAKPHVKEVLNQIKLNEYCHTPAGSLPLLDRKRLELGKALATRPELMLIDEVAGGLTEKEAEELLLIVKKIQQNGVTIIWIEHILMMMSEGGVDRLLVIAEGGRKLQCGLPSEVMRSQDVLECYLGTEES